MSSGLHSSASQHQLTQIGSLACARQVVVQAAPPLQLSRSTHLHGSDHLPSYVQGPVARVHISEVSLGRSHTASKALQGVAKAASTRHFKVPFSIRGVRIELRDAAEQQAGMRLAAPAANSSKHSAAGSQKPRKQNGAIKLLINSVLRIVVGLLPSIPLRIKDVEVVHQVTNRQQWCRKMGLKCDQTGKSASHLRLAVETCI